MERGHIHKCYESENLEEVLKIASFNDENKF